MSITLFSQIIGKLDRLKFNKLVKEYGSDKHQKGYHTSPKIAKSNGKVQLALI